MKEVKLFSITKRLVFFIISIILCAVSAALLYAHHIPIYAALCAAVLVILGFFVIRQLHSFDKKNKILVDALLYDDLEIYFSGHEKEVNVTLNMILSKYRKLRVQKEFQDQYNQIIINNIDFGIICFDQSGMTTLINETFRKMLHKSYIPNLEAIKKQDIALYNVLRDMKAGDVKIYHSPDLISQQIFKIKKTNFVFDQQEIQLFSFADISRQLNEQEVLAWDKLTRVLTHEIMNSISPIASLSSAMNQRINKQQNEIWNEEDLQDLKLSLQTIENRSLGLLEFTKQYKRLSSTLILQVDDINTNEWGKEIYQLLYTELDQKSIHFKISIEGVSILRGDKNLLTQSVLNLVRNAIESFDGTQTEKNITLKIEKIQTEVHLSVADNGQGIDEETLQNIFVPFYTTKEKGSGIGLSLTRKIIHAHGWEIKIFSKRSEGTVVLVIAE